MKLTLRPIQITFLGSFAKLYISRSSSAIWNGTDLHLLEIILDKESYQRLIDADLSTPPRIISALESVNHCIGEYDLSIILAFLNTLGMSTPTDANFEEITAQPKPTEIFKSPSTTPDPDRELTVLFNDGDILNKITWKNNKLRIDSNEIRGIVFFEKIKAWAYTDELLQAHNISLPEKETKAEPEAKAQPEAETSTVEPSTDDDKMPESQKMAIYLFDSAWYAMHKEKENPLSSAQQHAISMIDYLIANLLTMTPKEVREITKYLKQKLSEQQNS